MGGFPFPPLFFQPTAPISRLNPTPHLPMIAYTEQTMIEGRQIGIGVDIVSVKRIEELIKRWDGKFLERVFGEQEIRDCQQKPHPARSLAARFAAKEAFIKALGGAQGLRFRDIELRTTENGSPRLFLSERILRDYGHLDTKVSIAHEKEFAVAIVLVLSEVRR